MIAVEAQAAGLPVLASNAVPSEAIVVAELYDSMALDDNFEKWATALLLRIAKPKPAEDRCRTALENSDFNIVNSAKRLRKFMHWGHEVMALVA